MFESFFIREGTPTALLLQGSYRPGLVLLSLSVASLTSMVALQVAGMAREAGSRGLRQTALLSGSFAQGVGIWAMHFIGMLAFDLCSSVRYDQGITLLSMLPAVFGAWVTLNMLSHERVSPAQLMVGGVLVGSGIGTMHYTGMAAMVMAPALRYEPGWFFASIAVAVALAMLALWIRFGLGRGGVFTPLQSILLGGVVMGVAIAGMHYTGMAAARFIGSAEPGYQAGANQNGSLALAVSLFTVCAGVFVMAGNALLRYRQLMGERTAGEARLRAIVDTAVDGIITIDAQGKVLSLNRAAEQLFGWRADELVGRNVNHLMPEPHRSAHDGYLSHYLDSGDARAIGVAREVSALRKDGTVFPIRLAVGKVEHGGEPMFVGFITDISQRRQMERELAKRETQYRTLIANIPGVAFRSLVDEQWSKIFISDAITELCGWDKELILSGKLSLASIIHPDDLQRVRDTVAEAVANHRSYIVEYRIFHFGGGERWVSESAGIVFDLDDTPQWIDGVLIDITDSKMRAAEHEGVVYAIRRALAVAEFDMNGRILDANDNFLALTGYRPDELLGQHHSILCNPGETDAASYRAFWLALRTGAFQGGEYCRRRRDGRELWIQAVYNPILDADGKPWKVVKLANDVTVRKAMERDLTEARDRAEQAAAAKGMFLANMSHEIRTPMNAIIGFAELLLDTPLTPQQQRHLQTVRQSARSLLGLLNDILDTAKLERGALELDEADFSLHGLCEQLMESFALQAKAKPGLALRLEYDAACPAWVHGDALRMRQVLTNLLGNAVKFTEAGSVVLHVARDGGALLIEVRDTGIGIAPERLDSIFAPFTQADASMARRFGGTGLGTTIARQLIELMGGVITVDSRIGEGSVFSLRLPFQEAIGAAALSPVPGRLALPALSVLAVDDVPENLELLQMMLAREGMRVTVAEGGSAALQRFAEARFDIILMDVQMPDMDGLTATRQMRERERLLGLPAVPIIALTASVLSQDRHDAQAAGMNGFAGKPVDMDALKQEMARVLGLAHAVETGHAPAAGVVIDWKGAAARWGGAAALTPRIRRFLTDYQDAPSTLAGADRDACRQLAHRLRGVAGNLGLTQVQQLAEAIESAGHCDPASSKALRETMAAVAAELPAEAAHDEPANDAPLNAAALPLLQRVAEACRQGRLDDDALAALAGLLPASGLGALCQALDDFDFDAAEALVADWQAKWDSMAASGGETENNDAP